MSRHEYLIESIEHSRDGEIYWWRPDECGYTRFFSQAGRYPKQRAEEICAKANVASLNERMWSEEDVMNELAGKHELIVLAPEEMAVDCEHREIDHGMCVDCEKEMMGDMIDKAHDSMDMER